MYLYKELESRDGYKILTININGREKILGSKYNQKREIDKFIKSCGEITENDTYLIWGLSFGEHIEELLKKIDRRVSVIIVEFNKEWIGKLELTYDKNVTIVSNEEEIVDVLKNNISNLKLEFLKIVDYCGYEKIYSEKSISLLKKVKEEVESSAIDRNTSIMFAETWHRCLLENLKNSKYANSVEILKNAYENKPAIIVSAGPSLSKNIDLLKDVNNALIITGGRTLKSLINKGINYHCLGVVDPGEISYELVAKYIDNVKAPLLYYEGTNNKIVEKCKSKKILFSYNRFFTDIWGENTTNLSSGGSVAHSLTSFAISMGCNPIIFIGQDLAYTGEKVHSNLAYADKISGVDIKDIEEKEIFNLSKREDDLYVEDIYGKKVRTSIVLNSFIKSFEYIVESNKNIKFIDATEGGAKIEGTEIMTLKEVLKLLPREEIESLDSKLPNIDYSSKIDRSLSDLFKIFSEYKDVCKKAIEKTYLIEKKYMLGDNFFKELNELEILDSKLMNNLEKIDILRDLSYKYVYEIEHFIDTIATSEDNEKIKLKKNMLKSRRLYDAIIKCIKDTEEMIKSLEIV